MAKTSETNPNGVKGIEKVRQLLRDAVDELGQVAADPATPRDDAFTANDLQKSLKRFAAKL